MPEWNDLIATRLARLSLRPAREREVIDELAQHLDDRYHELRADGRSDGDAVRLALAELDDDINGGNLLAAEMRTLRQARPSEPIAPGSPSSGLFADVRRDIVYAARMLRQAPGFALAAILTLALGIGANTAIFSLVNSTLLRHLPVTAPDRVDYLFNGTNWNVLSYPDYVAIRDGARTFHGIAAWGGITASLNADGETDLVSGIIMTGNLFELLGISASHGRLLSPSDDVTPGAHPVAVISDRLWRTRFASRPDIVGTTIRLNGGMFTIVGVTPPEFPGPQLGVRRDLYVPMMMQALMRPPRAGYSGEQNPDLLKNPNNSWLFQLARRKDGVSREQAQADLVAVATAYAQSRGLNARPPRLVLVPIDGGDPNARRQMQSVALLLTGVVAAVLLIACANVANLLLARATARRREVAIRVALGASRWRIVRQLLTESVTLAALGGAAGVLIAWLIARAFASSPPPAGALPIALDFAIDRRVLLFSCGLSLVTGVVFGVVPALQASRPALVPGLKDDATPPDGRARRFNLKKGLVVSEVALSALLLIAAGLFARSLSAVQAVDPGYAVDEIVSAPLNINLLRYTRAQGREFYERIIERMETVPGVKNATVARIAVLTGGARVTTIAIEGRPDSGNRTQSEGGGFATTAGQTSLANVVGPGFFGTLGIPLLRGRDFTAQDRDDRPPVAIVSETMARQFFANENPIGRRFATGARGSAGPWIEIIGVARDSKYASLSEAASPIVYLPVAQQHETGMVLYVRAAGPPGALVAQVRREIQALEPNLPVPNIQTMTESIGTSLYVPRMGAALLAVFGGLALLLASLGVYGVLAFSVARRTREIGLRMALGATRRQVVGLVLREGMALVAIGLAIGVGAGLYASGALAAFLFDVSARDARTFVVAPCVLAAVALLACYLPARRAVRVDPMAALRQ